MDWFITAITALGAVLLPVAAVLLLEELTLGGLARMLLTPQPVTSKRPEPQPGRGAARRPPLEEE
jgi:hypothetical protein